MISESFLLVICFDEGVERTGSFVTLPAFRFFALVFFFRLLKVVTSSLAGIG